MKRKDRLNDEINISIRVEETEKQRRDRINLKEERERDDKRNGVILKKNWMM